MQDMRASVLGVVECDDFSVHMYLNSTHMADVSCTALVLETWILDQTKTQSLLSTFD